MTNEPLRANHISRRFPKTAAKTRDGFGLVLRRPCWPIQADRALLARITQRGTLGAILSRRSQPMQEANQRLRARMNGSLVSSP